MELVQCRMVSDDVEGLAGFYARLLGVAAALNEYYVEIQAGPASVGFSRSRFTEHREAGGVILDFQVRDVDAEFARIAALGVDWVLPPTTQPWGSRSMMFRDPAGNLVNVFSRCGVLPWIRDARGHDDDAGVAPGALTAVLIGKPRGERSGAFACPLVTRPVPWQGEDHARPSQARP